MRSRRLIKLGVLTGATLLMASGAYVAEGGLRILALERQRLNQAKAQLGMAQRLLPEVERREKLQQSVKDIQARVAATGFDPKHWGERRIRRPLGPASRVEVADFLMQIRAAAPGAVLVADAFELGTLSPSTGLFDPPEPGDLGVQFGLSGTLYIPRVGVSQP